MGLESLRLTLTNRVGFACSGQSILHKQRLVTAYLILTKEMLAKTKLNVERLIKFVKFRPCLIVFMLPAVLRCGWGRASAYNFERQSTLFRNCESADMKVLPGGRCS